MTIATPPLSISFDGPDYQTVGDGAGTPEQGGYDGEYQSNGSPDTGRLVQTPTGWRLNDQAIEIDLATDQWDYLNDKKNNGIKMEIVITYRDRVLAGNGYIEGKLTLDPMTSTASVTCAGPGKLEPV